MSDITLAQITSGYKLSKINSNFTILRDAHNDVAFWLSGGNNTMLQDIDLNGFDLLNVGTVNTGILTIGGVPVVPSNLGSFAPNSVGTIQIVDGAVTSNKLAPNSVSDTNITNVSGSKATFLQAGAGALTRSLQDKGRDKVNIKDFGAKCDGVTDDTTAWLTAIATGVPLVEFSGNTVVSATLIPADFQVIEGASDKWGGISIITVAAGLNAPVFKLSNQYTALRNFQISGSGEVGVLSGQSLVYVNNANGATLEKLFLKGGYDNVYIDGTSFYVTIDTCTFYDAYNSQLNVTSAASAGVDLIMRGCRFLNGPATMQFCAGFTGAGSMLMNDCQFSTNLPSVATLYLNTISPGWGGAQFTNCVFENGVGVGSPGVYVKGTLTNPYTYLRFQGCILNGANGPGLKADFMSGAQFVNCGFSSVVSAGILHSAACASADNVFTNCGFDGSVVPVQALTGCTVSGTFTNCVYTGGNPFIDFNTANVTYLNVIGGKIGTNTNPITLSAPASTQGIINVNRPWNTYSPTVTSGSGTITSYVATGFYTRIGKTVQGNVVISMTNNGTGASFLNVSLPVACAVSPCVASGYATTSGKMLKGTGPAGSTTIGVANYDNTYPASTGESINLFFTYQVA